MQVALFTLLGMLANPVSGVIIDAQGYQPVFGLVILLACVSLGILRGYFSPPARPQLIWTLIWRPIYRRRI